MLNSFAFFIAVRYFKTNKKEKFISIASKFSLFGIAIGVAALIIVMSIMNGFHRELVKHMIGFNGDIVITKDNGVIDNYHEIKELLLLKRYVSHVIPSITGQVLVLGNKSNVGAIIYSLRLEDFQYKRGVISKIKHGSLVNFSGKTSIAIGEKLSERLGSSIGDKIRLISTNSVPTFIGDIPRSKEFEIVAIFSSGIYDYDSSVVLIPIDSSRSFLSINKGVNLIEVHTKEHNSAKDQAQEIQSILGKGIRATSWIENHAQFLNALNIERTAMFSILSLIVIIAVFNIVSSLIMLVKDKAKDIAVLKTIGASNSQIMIIFIANGMIIGTLGTIIGVIIGISISYNINSIKNLLERIMNVKLFDAVIYFLYKLPSEIHYKDILIISLFSLLLCLTATIYPSYKASKLNPTDLLRYE